MNHVELNISNEKAEDLAMLVWAYQEEIDFSTKIGSERWQTAGDVALLLHLHSMDEGNGRVVLDLIHCAMLYEVIGGELGWKMVRNSA